MNYQIDLNRICRSIESNNLINTEEYIRSIEELMVISKADYANSKAKIEAALGKMHDHLSKHWNHIVDKAVKDAIAKSKTKIGFTEKSAAESIKDTLVLTEKNQFIKEMTRIIHGEKYLDQEDGAVLVEVDNEAFRKLFGSNLVNAAISIGVGYLLNLTFSILYVTIMGILGLAMNPVCGLLLVLAKPVGYALNIGTTIGTVGRIINQPQNLAVRNASSISKVGLKKTEFEKYFKVTWNFGIYEWKKLADNKELINYLLGGGKAKLLVIPKFKVE